ncbi:MAG TPA: sigma factor-like helix-turn-helix DNA-binding protein [Azospirillum sp.]
MTRSLAANPDHVVDCHAHACAHCGTAVTAETQTLRHAYDHIALPPLRPVVTRVRLFGQRWGAQQGDAETHQVCRAHVLRDVQYAVDAGEACFAPALRRLVCWAIAVGRRRPSLKDSTVAQYRATAERRRDQVRDRAATAIEALAGTEIPPSQPGHVELRRTMEAFARLPEEQRRVLTLVAVEGMGYQEAAAVLGIPMGTLMSRLARGREALRHDLGRIDPERRDGGPVHLRVVR